MVTNSNLNEVVVLEQKEDDMLKVLKVDMLEVVLYGGHFYCLMSVWDASSLCIYGPFFNAVLKSDDEYCVYISASIKTWHYQYIHRHWLTHSCLFQILFMDTALQNILFEKKDIVNECSLIY